MTRRLTILVIVVGLAFLAAAVLIMNPGGWDYGAFSVKFAD